MNLQFSKRLTVKKQTTFLLYSVSTVQLKQGAGIIWKFSHFTHIFNSWCWLSAETSTRGGVFSFNDCNCPLMCSHMWDFLEHSGCLPRTNNGETKRHRDRETETDIEREYMSKKELIFLFMILTLKFTHHHLDQMLLINAVICLSEDQKRKGNITDSSFWW